METPPKFLSRSVRAGTDFYGRHFKFITVFTVSAVRPARPAGPASSFLWRGELIASFHGPKTIEACQEQTRACTANGPGGAVWVRTLCSLQIEIVSERLHVNLAPADGRDDNYEF